MYTYILCEFTYGYSGKFYQEITNGVVTRNTDLDGNTLNLNGSYGAIIVDSNPLYPTWAPQN